MKIVHIIIGAFIFSILWKNCHSQIVTYPNLKDSTIIQIKEFYEGYGKIFDLRSINNLKLIEYSKKPPVKIIFLNEENILLSEKIFCIQYNQVLSQDNRFIGFKPVNVKKKYRTYYRQYVAYEDVKGDKFVQIYLLNFKQKKIAEKYFYDWSECCPAIGFGDFYSRNQFFALINISSKKLIIP